MTPEERAARLEEMSVSLAAARRDWEALSDARKKDLIRVIPCRPMGWHGQEWRIVAAFALAGIAHAELDHAVALRRAAAPEEGARGA